MKIGLVIEQLDPRRGGVEQWTYQFARRIVQQGHELHVVARRFSPETRRLGLIAHALEVGSGRLAFAEAAEYKLRALPLDVIHDTGCGWHCDLFQPHGGSRVASFEQNLLLQAPWLRPLKRRAAQWLPRYHDFRRLNERQYGAADRLFAALSNRVADDLRRYHGVRDEQLRIVYNGVDIERFSPRQRAHYRDALRAQLGIAPHEVACLIIAHNFALKGVPTLLRAAGILRRAGHPVRLLIVGGKRQRKYEWLAARAGVADVTSFTGSADDTVPYYAAADLYAQPTFYDPCSLVVLEALACGLPVVTSRFNGAGELITPEIQGDVVEDPADHEELASALEPLFDSARRQRMGEAARVLALRHTIDRNCDQILRLYGEVVGRKRGRRAA